MPKRIVYYIPHKLDKIRVGFNGFLVNPPIGHTSEYVTGTKSVLTSVILDAHSDGFETLNTIYKVQKDVS